MSLKVPNQNKIIRQRNPESWDQFDLSTDPGEQTMLTAEDPASKNLIRFAEQTLETQLEVGPALRESSETDSSTLSEDTIQRLIELGYVR